jgi:multimeric flavodoxin WrbA
MLKILTLTGSPVEGSSTDILLNEIFRGIESAAVGGASNEFVRLNDLTLKTCQACGESPEPEYCFFKDDIYPIYDKLINLDIILIGSPVYFDSVSAQSKIFIDRCNCLRPPDFEAGFPPRFKKIITKKRYGGMVLVGGERGKFEPARQVIAGWFQWLSIENCGTIIYGGTAWDKIGPVKDDKDKMRQAFEFGREIVSCLS